MRAVAPHSVPVPPSNRLIMLQQRVACDLGPSFQVGHEKYDTSSDHPWQLAVGAPGGRKPSRRPTIPPSSTSPFSDSVLFTKAVRRAGNQRHDGNAGAAGLVHKGCVRLGRGTGARRRAPGAL